MSKENNLKEYLKDLYDGIKTKKPDASRNPQDFKRDILSIQTGGTLPTLSKPATADHIQYGKEAYNDKGGKIVGTVPHNGDVSQVIDGINTDYVDIPAGITSGGRVSIASNISTTLDAQSNLIAEITALLSNKVKE
jgi:hypothetical protein